MVLAALDGHNTRQCVAVSSLIQLVCNLISNRRAVFELANARAKLQVLETENFDLLQDMLLATAHSLLHRRESEQNFEQRGHRHEECAGARTQNVRIYAG